MQILLPGIDCCTTKKNSWMAVQQNDETCGSRDTSYKWVHLFSCFIYLFVNFKSDLFVILLLHLTMFKLFK